MGFSECQEFSIVFKKDTVLILFLASKFFIYKSESIDSMFTLEHYRRYYDIDDNFEQELFEKLKELQSA